jgi:hypothetical protein
MNGKHASSSNPTGLGYPILPTSMCQADASRSMDHRIMNDVIPMVPERFWKGVGHLQRETNQETDKVSEGHQEHCGQGQKDALWE